MAQHQFRKLVVWQQAMIFTTKIYELTSKFPRTELFGLTDQIRRAVVSISLNIAEGSGSSTNIEFCRFLYIAKRSGYEVMTGLEIAKNLHYIDSTQFDQHIIQAEEICSMISVLISKFGKS